VKIFSGSQIFAKGSFLDIFSRKKYGTLQFRESVNFISGKRKKLQDFLENGNRWRISVKTFAQTKCLDYLSLLKNTFISAAPFFLCMGNVVLLVYETPSLTSENP
jgi:hypothetical protein